jgi:2'-5' RNA ligase
LNQNNIVYGGAGDQVIQRQRMNAAIIQKLRIRIPRQKFKPHLTHTGLVSRID